MATWRRYPFYQDEQTVEEEEDRFDLPEKFVFLGHCRTLALTFIRLVHFESSIDSVQKLFPPELNLKTNEDAWRAPVKTENDYERTVKMCKFLEYYVKKLCRWQWFKEEMAALKIDLQELQNHSVSSLLHKVIKLKLPKDITEREQGGFKKAANSFLKIRNDLCHDLNVLTLTKKQRDDM